MKRLFTIFSLVLAFSVAAPMASFAACGDNTGRDADTTGTDTSDSTSADDGSDAEGGGLLRDDE